MKKHKHDYDLIVIGSGAGGGVGAHYAAKRGKKVVIFEQETEAMGGECPNWACVPTKALLHSAEVYRTLSTSNEYGIHAGSPSINYRQVKAWKNLVVSRTGSAEGESAFTRDNTLVIRKKAMFDTPYSVVAGNDRFTAKRFLVATGSQTIIPPIHGLEDVGYSTFRNAINYNRPPKSLFIIGGGAIGCEFAELFSSFGTKVYIADISPRLLAREEPETGELIQALFERRNVKVLTNTLVTSLTKSGSAKIVHYTQNSQEHTARVEDVLVATGKKPVLDFGYENAKIKLSSNSVRINSYLQTTNPNVYMAGDVIGPYQFTHTASYQSRIATHNAFSKNKLRVNYDAIPRCIFTTPESASVGITEHEASLKGIKTKSGASPINILGRANTSNEFDGFVKVITNQRNVIIGASIVSPNAGEMIHELALAITKNVTAGEIANLVHAFPTYSQAIRNACETLLHN
jgi:mercuric reductase